MAQVFISYRHVEPDESVARFLHRHLSELDHDVFIDARDIPVGSFWDKEIAANVARAQYFVPLVSLSYLHSRYILDKELAVAARLLKERQIERILQVNLAFDGEAPREVREVVEQVQHFKWRSPEDTPRLAEEIAARLPSPQALVKGMRSFDVSDARPFKQLGRASEVADFLALLRQDPARHVLLHGVSGAGKTSFLKAGVLPRLGDPPPPVFELSEKVCEEFAAAAAGGGALIFLDQFEQALIRLANDEAEHRAFAAAVESFTRGRPASRLVFCIRDEYRTAFDTMLPEVSRRCARFPLLPLRPEVAASVLALMLDDARAEYDADFLPGLCAERLAEGVPKTVLPALLQMVAQYCRNRGGKLDKGLWDGLMLSGGSLFEDHVREAVLEKVPSRLPRVQAAQALAALTAGVVKSRPLSAAQIADDYQLKEEVVGRTLEVSTLPHARVVLAEADEERKETRYRLVHDLFAPAVQALARETKLAREKRRRNQLVGLFAGLAALSLAAGAAAWWQRGVARRQGEIAVARQLAMQSNGLRAADAGGLMRSLLFAAESHRLYPNADSDASVRAALALAPLHVARLEHKTIVNAAPRFSRDGAMLVTGGFGGGVRVWDVGARRPLANFDAGQPVNRVAFSRGGAAVAAGAGGQDMKGNPNPNGVALAWDVRGGRELARADFVSPVVDVAFVGDTGRLAAVASEAAKVFGGDGSPPLTIPLGEGVGATALSPDGGLLAVAKGLRVELYELPSGRLLATLDVGAEDVLPASAGRTEPTPAHKSIFGLAFDAGGARLAAAAGAGVIRVWDVAARRPLATIKEPVERTSFLALSDDGALVAYTNYYGTTGVWHVESGTRVASIVPDTRAFNAFSTAMRTVFRPGSHDLFTPGGGSSARMHRIFDARGRVSVRDGAFEALRLMPGTRGITAPLAASPDGRHVVTVQYGEVDLWELKGGAAAAEALGSYRAAFSPSGRYFAAQTTGDRVEVFDLEARAAVASLAAARDSNQPEVPAFVFGGGRLAVLAGQRDVIEVYDESGREKVGRAECRCIMRAFTFAPGGRELLFSLSDNSLWRAGMDGGAAVEVVKGGEHTIRFSPGGGYFYHTVYLPESGGRRPVMLEVFETSGGRRVLSTPVYDGGTLVRFSDDERYVAAFAEEKGITVWETGGWRVARRFDTETAYRSDADFGGGDLLAVTAWNDVHVWNVRTGEPVAKLHHDGGYATGVAFSRPDARHLLTTCNDGRARVWDLKGREVVASVEGVKSDARPAFSADGKHFVTVGIYNSGAGESVRAQATLWRPEDLRAEVCRRVASNLSTEDWAQYASYRPAEKTCPELP